VEEEEDTQMKLGSCLIKVICQTLALPCALATLHARRLSQVLVEWEVQQTMSFLTVVEVECHI